MEAKLPSTKGIFIQGVFTDNKTPQTASVGQPFYYYCDYGAWEDKKVRMRANVSFCENIIQSH